MWLFWLIVSICAYIVIWLGFGTSIREWWNHYNLIERIKRLSTKVPTIERMRMLTRTAGYLKKKNPGIDEDVFVQRCLEGIPKTEDNIAAVKWMYLIEGFALANSIPPKHLDSSEGLSYINRLSALTITPDQAIPIINKALKRIVPGEWCEQAVADILKALPATALYIDKDSPLRPLMRGTFPLPAPYKTYFEHMWIVGGTGVGKSQWLAQLFLRHAKHESRPSIVFVDSQGDLIHKFQTLEVIQDRVIYINPRHPPSIRLFGEGSVEIFDYLFSGIIGADLTAKQAVFFRMMAKLLQSIPGATIMDMFYMMNDITPYKKHIEKLPNLQRLFFQQDFNSKTFQQTKEQVRYRLNALLENKTLQHLLDASNTPLNLEKALNAGAVILVDTSKEHLKSASPAFGRIFVALILQAIYNRASIPEDKRRPTFLLIDEAHEVFDTNIDDLLTQVRKYKCGAVFAHQYLGQCTPQLRESLAANTSIKMVSGVSAPDARSLAPELRTTPEFILRQKPLSFATYVRNVTEKAVSIEVTPGLLDKEKHVQFIPEHTPPPERIHTPHSQDNVSTDASQTW